MVIILDKRSYSVSRDKMKNESIYFEYDKIDGYQVKPKATKKNAIEVSKIIFVNDSMSEKIIRRKVDKKINDLLKQLKLIEEDDSSDDGAIKKSLMDAEKLRYKIISEYAKYLGNTYQNLTLSKIQIIINQLRFELFKSQAVKMQSNIQYEEYQSKRGR